MPLAGKWKDGRRRTLGNAELVLLQPMIIVLACGAEPYRKYLLLTGTGGNFLPLLTFERPRGWLPGIWGKSQTRGNPKGLGLRSGAGIGARILLSVSRTAVVATLRQFLLARFTLIQGVSNG
jgi:hypothetical protein